MGPGLLVGRIVGWVGLRNRVRAAVAGRVVGGELAAAAAAAGSMVGEAGIEVECCGVPC